MWNKLGSVNVTSTSLAFFQQFDSSIAIGTYSSLSATFSTLTSAVKNFADGFVAVVAEYTPSNGGLAEQFSNSNGSPLSAVDLTWSYAASLTAFGARAGVVPASWGAAGLTTACSGGGGGGGGTGTIPYTFNVQATTVPGGKLFIMIMRVVLIFFVEHREYLPYWLSRCVSRLVPR